MNTKTRTDLMFERYLNQRRLTYKFEPFSTSTRNPDYKFQKNKYSVAVECEEIEKLPIDYIRPGAGSLRIDKAFKIIREKIDDASKQLKLHVDKVDYLVIIIGKKSGYEISFDFLYWAMFGDPFIRVPVYEDYRKGAKPYFDLKVKGALRKNNPLDGKMYFPHSYIGGIGLIKEFNGLQHYKSLLYREHCEKERNSGNLKEDFAKAIKFFQDGWKKYQNKIPHRLLVNPDQTICKIEIIVNPLSDKPVPKNLFNARWDLYRKPSVIQSLYYQ